GLFAGSLTGTGGFTKAGGGTFTLSGNNSYSGATSVTGGTLTAGSLNAFGAGGPLLLGAGTTADLNGFNQTVGSLAGTGSLLLGGGAFLTVGNDNSSTAFGGTISGSGGLIKAGSGVLSLTGATSNTGGLQVLGGTLLGNTSSLLGNILNNATVVFDQGSNGTYSGTMSGSGALVKNGAGALTLTGPNTYSGGTFINAGSLIGTTNSVRGFILNNAALTLDQSFDGAFNGLIAGTGTVTKLGTGNVTFGSTNTYTGLTTVGQGTLTINGGLPGSVSVGTQATLSGTGTIVGNVTVGGRLFVPSPTATPALTARAVRAINGAGVSALQPFA